MTLESEALEAKKAAWTDIQLDIARKAVFEDCDLSFEVRSALPSSQTLVKQQDSNTSNVDAHFTPVHRSQGTIHGLTAVAGLDIGFFKDDPNNAIAALTVLSFPDMRVSPATSPHVKDE